jgi:signal transduction histidine kinase
VAACLVIAVSVRRDTIATVRELAKIEFTSSAVRTRQFSGYLDAARAALAKDGQGESDDPAEIIRHTRTQVTDWLANRRAAARTDRESQLVGQLMAQSQDYFSLLHAASVQGTARTPSANRAALAAADDRMVRLRRTISQYEAAHDDDLDQLLQSALRAVMWMRNLLFVCVALLIGAIALGTALLFRDVVRPLRGQLAESEKLAALGTLAAGIAHEIRNPLTAIKARLYTLTPTLTLPDSKEDALAIGHEADRLERIVRDVLGYARPAKPAMERLNLAAWLEEFAADIRSNFDLGAIALVTEMMVEVTVRVDADQLRQILLNLVRNAQEALEGQTGCIRLRLTRELAHPRGQSADFAVLSVTDNGPGIPAKVQGRLFDPFFTTKTAGTGLGLSIVARLVQNQAGQISFESSCSSGTRFTVRLPAVSPPSPLAQR